MTGGALLAYCGLAAVLTLVPGVDFALVTRTAAVHGTATAVRTSWGIVSGLMVWGAVSALGVAAVLAASATAYDALRLAGAAYLIGLGLLGLRSRGESDHGRAAPARRPYVTGLLTNVTNPKIVVFYATVVPGFLSKGAPVLPWTLLAAAIHAAMGIVWLGVCAHAVGRARALLERPRLRAWIDRVGGAVLVALGVRLALERR